MSRKLLPIHKYKHLSSVVVNESRRNSIAVNIHERTYNYALEVGVILNEGKTEANLSAEDEHIPKLIETVEYLRPRIHQLKVSYKIVSVEIRDTYEPMEEGLDTVVLTRHKAVLKATLAVKSPLNGFAVDVINCRVSFKFQKAVLKKINLKAIDGLKDIKKKKGGRKKKRRPRRNCFLKKGDESLLTGIDEEEEACDFRNRNLIERLEVVWRKSKFYNFEAFKRVIYSLKSEQCLDVSGKRERRRSFFDN